MATKIIMISPNRATSPSMVYPFVICYKGNVYNFSGNVKCMNST